MLAFVAELDEVSSLSEACSTPIIGASSRTGSSHKSMDLEDIERSLQTAHLMTRASLSSLGVSSFYKHPCLCISIKIWKASFTFVRQSLTFFLLLNIYYDNNEERNGRSKRNGKKYEAFMRPIICN
jgi:hypothetical protein